MRAGFISTLPLYAEERVKQKQASSEFKQRAIDCAKQQNSIIVCRCNFPMKKPFLLSNG
jgi:hypothetical protein